MEVMDNNLVNIIIAVPILGSVLILLLKERDWNKILSSIFVFVSFVLVVVLYYNSFSNNFSFQKEHRTTYLFIDNYAIVMALVSSFISFLIILYSYSYMKSYDRQNEYYFYVTLFIGSMLGLIFSSDLILMYIFWEITSICSWKLISFYKKEQHIFAANKAFLITFLGSAMMLLGISILFADHRTFNLIDLKGRRISDLAMLLIFCGMISKSAQVPFHTWLPEAGVAPTPVTALLHAAVLVKIGVYTFGRIFVFTLLPSPVFQNFVMWLSLLTILFSGLVAYVEKDIKRILAYSTISQIGYIFLGFATNVYIGIIGSIFYIVSHGIAKAGLFLAAGVIEHNTHERDITKLGGLYHTMPITSIAFLLCAMSVIGFPLLSGFFAKFFVVSGIVASGKIFIAVGAILGAVITMLYLLRVYNKVFLGEKKFEVREETKIMLFVIILLGIISIILGIFPQTIINFLVKDSKLI